MSADRRAQSAEIVPVSDRARYMDGFRAALVALVVAIAIAAPGSLLVARADLLLATGAFALIAAAAHVLFAAVPRVQLPVFGLMLLLDGAFLAWAAYGTGAAESPLRFVMILHVVAVALLASYRTGLKVALWHSLLLTVVFYAQEGGLLEATTAAGIGIGTPFERLLEFSALFWVVAIATAAFSAVNERELRRRRYDTEALATMATQLESVTQPGDVATTLVDSVATTFDFHSVVLIASREGGAPEVLASRGRVADGGPVRFDAASSGVANACAEGQSVLVGHLDRDEDAWLSDLLPGARNVLAVPLVAEGQPLGVLVAVHGRRLGARIARRVVSMVERFVSHGTLALRNAWLLEQVHHMATTDGLTGVANRATFDRTLFAELGRAARRREDASLLLLDIDHFKALNDEHGHQVGDQVLRLVGTALTAACREFDTAARYGGEEFAVLLPATSSDEAVEVAERLRTSIAEMPSGLDVTVSVGVASFPLDATGPDGLVAAADHALYRSKRTGRNRVTTSADAERFPPTNAPV
jgi:diguanylate cyclase (GGDEF)-like protein